MVHWFSKPWKASRIAKHSLWFALLVTSVLVIASFDLFYNKLPVSSTGIEFEITSGDNLSKVLTRLQAVGIVRQPLLLKAYAKVSANTKIQAGEYRLTGLMSKYDMLRNFKTGKVQQHAFTIVPGWTLAETLQELSKQPKLKHLTLNRETLGYELATLEGWLLPDTYLFPANTSNVDFLQRATSRMQAYLEREFKNKSADCMLETAYEALILASIIEKESGFIEEYAKISGVYQRRLAKRMRLQADPTIVYALNTKLPNGLRYKHLRLKSPYNTYLNHGLPPTPIAMPSQAAVYAALHPEPGEELYFVAKGDGSHVFSTDFRTHCQNIRQKQPQALK